MKHYLYTGRLGDIANTEEVHVVEHFGKSACIDRYDPITEEWVRSSVNALQLVSEEQINQLRSLRQTA